MIAQILKMWWMFVWRLTVFCALADASRILPAGILISLVAAIALYVSGRSIRTWPILKFIFKHINPIIVFEKKTKPSFDNTFLAHERVIDQATQLGVMTGFEPRTLASRPIAYTPKMYGNPGAGLASSGFSNSSISLGQAGEVNFAKALSLQTARQGGSLLSSFETFWSVSMPSENEPWTPDSKFDTDIDSIILVGDTIYLVDLKNYSSGNVTYTTNGNYLLTRDNNTGILVGGPKQMSRNMAMAVDRFSKHFPTMKIEARVVLMPTDKGEGNINHVYWPGNIPAVTLRSFLAELSSKRVAAPTAKAQKVISIVPNLLKN